MCVLNEDYEDALNKYYQDSTMEDGSVQLGKRETVETMEKQFSEGETEEKTEGETEN